MKYVFFGTPRFAAIILERLINSGMPPTALVCNPDKPVGRRQITTPPATKSLIQKIGLPISIFQPETKGGLLEIGDRLFSEVNFGVLAAYSQIIPSDFIQRARLGIIGVHPSLLPKYRGPTPIQLAILAGEKETGVSLFLLDEKVDHGPIIASRRVPIDDNLTNAGELEEILAKIAGELLVEVIPKFIKGEIKLTPQEEAQATYTSKFTAEDSYINPGDLQEAVRGRDPEKAKLIYQKVKALNPEPGVYTFLDGKRAKILLTEIKEGKLVLKRIQYAGGKPVDVS